MTQNDAEWLLRVKLGLRASCFTQSNRLSKYTTKNEWS